MEEMMDEKNNNRTLLQLEDFSINKRHDVNKLLALQK
jgi:hypothetical protein